MLNKIDLDKHFKSFINLREILGGYSAPLGFIDKFKIILKDELRKCVISLDWNQEQIDNLIFQRDLIPCRLTLLKGNGQYIKTGYIFSSQIEKEYNDCLLKIIESYDFSEFLT